MAGIDIEVIDDGLPRQNAYFDHWLGVEAAKRIYAEACGESPPVGRVPIRYDHADELWLRWLEAMFKKGSL